jgi:hypothetical protein
LGCNTHPVRIDLVLYLVARLEDHAPYAERSALGYSITPDNGARATFAYVCYARVKKVVSAFSAGELLGLAIAHEIGHLLLGKNSHSNAGLMRPRWPSRDLEAKHWEEFTFTSEQVRRLRAAILARMTSEEPLPAIPAPLNAVPRRWAFLSQTGPYESLLANNAAREYMSDESSRSSGGDMTPPGLELNQS